MTKPKRKLTAAEKAAKAQYKAKFMTIFIDGRQKRVRRLESIESQDAEDLIERNADQIWLHENEMWERIVTAEPGDVSPASRDGELF